MAEEFRFELTGGVMFYVHPRDTWNAWSDRCGKVAEKDANAFKTIREFKAWAQGAVDAADNQAGGA